MPKKTATPKIEANPVSGAISVLKVLPYKGAKIYIRRIKGAFGTRGVVYEYLIIYQEELYSSFILVEMKRGQKELSDEDEIAAAGMIFTGAVTTIDTLLDADKILAKQRKKEANHAS